MALGGFSAVRAVPWLAAALAFAATGAALWRGYTFAPPGEEPVALEASGDGGAARRQAWLRAIAQAPPFGRARAQPARKPAAPARLPPARIDARLVGVVAGSFAAAILAVHGRQGIYWIGDEVVPGARLVEVGPDYAVVEHDGRRERLELAAPKGAAAARPPAPAPAARRAPAVPAPAVRGPRVQRRRIPRPWLRSQLARLPEILRQARVVPRYRDGKFAGFVITNIAPGSVYEKIGLQNGDVIEAVNGVVVKTPQEAMRMYEKLKDARSIAVRIERRGVEMTLNYEMR